MTDSSHAVSEIRSWWSGEGQERDQKIKNLQIEIAERRGVVDDIKNQKTECDPLKVLSYAWQRAVDVPILHYQIKGMEREEKCLSSLLSDKAAKDGDVLLAAIASEHELVWLSYSSILCGLKDLSGEQYDTAMSQYINLRLYVARNTDLPPSFYEHLPQGLAEEAKNPSAEWRFNM